MKLALSLAGVLIASFLAPFTAQARWDSKADNKPEPALEAMTDKELFNEAFDVCIRRAMVERQASDIPQLVTGVTNDASEYLGVIAQVASKAHGGSTPTWLIELTAAHTVKKCQRAFRTFLAMQEPTSRAKKKTAAHAAKTTAPHHGDPLEQLPPWLAPPPQ
jgi:hypothetical protein